MVSSRSSSSWRASESNSGHGQMPEKVRAVVGIVLDLLLLGLSRASSIGRGRLSKVFKDNKPAHTEQSAQWKWATGHILVNVVTHEWRRV